MRLDMLRLLLRTRPLHACVGRKPWEDWEYLLWTPDDMRWVNR